MKLEMTVTPRIALCVLIAIALGASAEPSPAAERAFDGAGRLFTSTANPAFTARIGEGLLYQGSLEFPLGETAWVERHVWADADEEGSVRRLVVLQFEGLQEQAEGRYRFVIPEGDGVAGSNYRFSPERVRLGDHEYVHNTWAFDFRADAEDRPDAESGQTLRFLAERGLALEAAWVMSRAVREVGEDARRELILFYMEPLSSFGHSLGDFPDGGPVSDAYDAVSQAVTQRGRAALNVLH